MFANTAVLAGEPRELVTVPRTALTYSLYGDSVWVVKEGTAEESAPATAATEQAGAAIAADAPEEGPKLIAERRFVRVGQVEEGRVAILDGIKAGEQVITSGQLKLQPGAAIQVNNADALKPPAVLPKQ
jgi:membrane fusion protein (multidrug efflux system)